MRVDAIGRVEKVESGEGQASSVIASGDEGSLPDLAQRVAVELDSRARFVVNRREMKLHKAASCGVGTPSEAWSTVCGWRFARQGSWVLQYNDAACGAVNCDHCFCPRSRGAECHALAYGSCCHVRFESMGMSRAVKCSRANKQWGSSIWHDQQAPRTRSQRRRTVRAFVRALAHAHARCIPIVSVHRARPNQSKLQR